MRMFLITDARARNGSIDRRTLLGLLALTDFRPKEFDQIADLLPGESYQLTEHISIRRVDGTH